MQHHDAAAEGVLVGLPERLEIGMRGQRRAGQQQLHVRHGRIRHHLGEAAMPPGMSLATLVPPSRYVSASATAMRSSRIDLCTVPPGGFALERDHRRDVVLQVLPDARQRHLRLDAGGAQRIGVADAGQHQHLRRVDHAAGEQHLAVGAHSVGVAAAAIFDADGAVACRARSRDTSAPVSTVRLGRAIAGLR